MPSFKITASLAKIKLARGEEMRILNQAQMNNSIQSTRVKRSHNGPKSNQNPQAEVVSNPAASLSSNLLSGDNKQKIVRLEKPQTNLSESEIRAKLEELKTQKEANKKKLAKDDFVTAMPDDIDIKDRKSPLMNKKALEDAGRENASKMTSKEISENKSAQNKPTEIKSTENKLVENKEIAVPEKIVTPKADPKGDAALQMKNKNEDQTLKSDVGRNDPTDTNVQEKLRDILKTGAFSFSQKEKDALSQILK